MKKNNNKSNDINKIRFREAELKREMLAKYKYFADAEKAADIVRIGIESKNYEEMNHKLEEFKEKESLHSKYVFKYPSVIDSIVSIIVSIMFSLFFLVSLFYTIGIIIYSGIYCIYGMVGTIIIAVFMMLNIYIISMGIKRIKYGYRYSKYIQVLRYSNIILINDLEAFAKEDKKTIIKDLLYAIKQKYIPQGHFSDENVFFMLTNKIFDDYKGNKGAYDYYYKKLLENRERMQERTSKIQEIMDKGEKYIKKIRNSNDIIKDKVVSDKLEQMENVVSMIFYELDINPSQEDRLGLFLNYYLPTTEKLLTAYVELCEKKVEGKSIQKTKKEIEDALDTINDSFEGILDKFYKEKEIDLISEISAMEIMMVQDR